MPNSKPYHENDPKNHDCYHCPWLLYAAHIRRFLHVHLAHNPGIIAKRQRTVENTSYCKVWSPYNQWPLSIAAPNSTSLPQNPFRGGIPANANNEIDRQIAVMGILLPRPLYFSKTITGQNNCHTGGSNERSRFHDRMVKDLEERSGKCLLRIRCQGHTYEDIASLSNA